MKRLISLVVSLGILVIIYTRIDFGGLIDVFKNCNPLWMVVSLGMVIPVTSVTAWRLQQVVPPKAKLGFGEALRLILAASVLNMVLPSKMGDIAKAYFMREKGGVSGALSLSIVVFEKASDMLSLLLWCTFGLLRYPEKGPFFWAMTVGVVGGLIIGLLLLGSSQFAKVFFPGGETIHSQENQRQVQNPAGVLGRNAGLLLGRQKTTAEDLYHLYFSLVFTPAANLAVYLGFKCYGSLH